MDLASCNKMAVCFMCYMVAFSVATTDDAKRENSLETIKNETKELKTALGEMAGSNERTEFSLNQFNLQKSPSDGETDKGSDLGVNDPSGRSLQDYDDTVSSLPLNQWPRNSQFSQESVDSNFSNRTRDLSRVKKHEEVVFAANADGGHTSVNGRKKNKSKFSILSLENKSVNNGQTFGAKLIPQNDKNSMLGYPDYGDDSSSYEFDAKNYNENFEFTRSQEDFPNLSVKTLRDEPKFNKENVPVFDSLDPTATKPSRCGPFCGFDRNRGGHFQKPLPINRFRSEFTKFDVNSLPIRGPEQTNDIVRPLKDENDFSDENEFSVNKKPASFDSEVPATIESNKPHFDPSEFARYPPFPPSPVIFPGTYPFPAVGVINGGRNPARFDDAARIMNRSPMIMLQFLPPMPFRPMYYHSYPMPRPMFRPPHFMRSLDDDEVGEILVDDDSENKRQKKKKNPTAPSRD